MTYRFTLERYKSPRSRYRCPQCGTPKVFTRYIDSETGEYLAEEVGRCDRAVNCGYHYTPKQYFAARRSLSAPPPQTFRTPGRSAYKEQPVSTQVKGPAPAGPSSIPVEPFKASLAHYEENCLVQYLSGLLGPQRALDVVRRYCVGTSKHRFRRSDAPGYSSRGGATVFWQVDGQGRVRTGKVMLYDPRTGKRIKEPFSHVHWAHRVLKLEGFHLQQCLFGEHLLKEDLHQIVAITESEKSALIASVYLPQFVWVACGSLNSLTEERCVVLKGRKVVLFPDLGAYGRWAEKARKLSHIAHFAVSDLLEQKASEGERRDGLDLADYLVRLPLTEFHPEPLKLYTPEIESLLGATYTGAEFGRLVIQGVRTKDGQCYDLLFRRDGELVQPGTQVEVVARLGAFFEKRWQTGYFNDVSCLLSRAPP